MSGPRLPSRRRGRGARSAPSGVARTAPGPRTGLALISASLGIFVPQLDFLAFNLALPRMASELNTTVTGLQWAVSGYMLALAACLIPGGRLGDILGRKQMLMAGLAVFGLCSLGAGLASSASVVIVLRVAQGAGAGLLFPLSVAVITDAFPQDQTMRAIGNAYGIGAVGLALGPVVGGGLTQLVSWRLVFLINVPLTAAAALAVWVGVRESRDTTVPRSIDLPGLVAVALGISAVTLAVDRLAVWPAGATVGVFAAGVLLLVAFVLWERVARWPLVALDLFRNVPYVIVTVMATVANVSVTSSVYCITIYLQEVEKRTPLAAGLVFLPVSLGAAVGGPLAGRLGERFDIPRAIAAATLVGGVGTFLVSLAGGFGSLLPGLAMNGLGYGIGWAMASVGTQTVVPPQRVGQASGVTLSIVIGVAGLFVTVTALAIEVGGRGPGLGEAIETVLRWIAFGSAAATVLLAMLAARLMPPSVGTSAD
ncbi:MFS transporter [Streptomyces sp. NPDC059176]|uniref:MFS transporter n=1 Tax=unclassified Streptomyces TaxID=2593676 RepID=UPI00367ADEBA